MDEMTDIMEVTDVDYLGEYKLLLTFNNGEKRFVDLDKHLVGPVFAHLREHEMFIQFGLTDTLEWVNGADFAPEFLYQIGTPVTHRVGTRLSEKMSPLAFPMVGKASGYLYSRGMDGGITPLRQTPAARMARDS